MKHLSRLQAGSGFVVVLLFWAQGALAAQSQELTQLVKAVALLESTPTGKAEVAKARELHIPVREGTVSKTEVTAVRVKQGNNEQLKFNTQVLISSNKDLVFQALDMAHELTHAIHPKENPFDPALSAEEYVRHGIEGEGGEAQAIGQECQVGKELIQQKAVKENFVELIKARCQYVWKTENDPGRWKHSFYQLGQYYQQFVSLIRGKADQFKVETKSPLFASAVAHKPYPLALLEEYVDITRTICNRAKNNPLVRITKLDQRCKEIENQ